MSLHIVAMAEQQKVFRILNSIVEIPSQKLSRTYSCLIIAGKYETLSNNKEYGLFSCFNPVSYDSYIVISTKVLSYSMYNIIRAVPK